MNEMAPVSARWMIGSDGWPGFLKMRGCMPPWSRACGVLEVRELPRPPVTTIVGMASTNTRVWFLRGSEAQPPSAEIGTMVA